MVYWKLDDSKSKLIKCDTCSETELKTPNNITVIGREAFLTIQDGVTHIEEFAFYDLDKLKSVYIRWW